MIHNKTVNKALILMLPLNMIIKSLKKSTYVMPNYNLNDENIDT
jgi:hypothetical protein